MKGQGPRAHLSRSKSSSKLGGAGAQRFESCKRPNIQTGGFVPGYEPLERWGECGQYAERCEVDTALERGRSCQAAQQNFHPKAVISSTAYDPSFFKLLGNPSYADNVVIYLEQAMYLGQDSSQVPEIGTMTQWVRKVHPGATMNLFTVDGWAAGLLFQQALEKAGSNPTQAILTSALKGVTSFTANGLLPTENISGHKISVCGVIVTTHGTNFVRTDPATSGFECNGTYVPYTGS